MRNDRLHTIEQLLREHGECSVERLARELGVSDMTVRRDLQRLADAGRVVRSHGGAAPVEQVLFEFQFLRRARHQREQKEAIGERAAALIEDGQSVLLDSGTTTLSLARHLVHRRLLFVIPTSLPIAATLQSAAGVETHLLGGVIRRDAPDLTGPLTESNLDAFRTDFAFIGADAVGADGDVYSNSMAVGHLLAKMASRANAVYVVADSSKVGRSALSRYGSVRGWAGLIVDSGIAPSDLASLQSAGVNVIVVDVPPSPRAASTPHTQGAIP
jgi:DeoR/GlpR family transcriptional regulator of sugar metabolism